MKSKFGKVFSFLAGDSKSSTEETDDFLRAIKA